MNKTIDDIMIWLAKEYPGHDQPDTEAFFSGIEDTYGVRVTDYTNPGMRFDMTMDAMRGVLASSLKDDEPDKTPDKTPAKKPKKKK
mgnify:FL=1